MKTIKELNKIEEKRWISYLMFAITGIVSLIMAFVEYENTLAIMLFILCMGYATEIRYWDIVYRMVKK